MRVYAAAFERRVQGQGRSGDARRPGSERADLRGARARVSRRAHRRGGERRGDATRASGAEPAAWFVDPLDGTREFVARNGEFAVMIGLAEAGRSRRSASSCSPRSGRAFVGAEGIGAFEVAADGARSPIHVSSRTELSTVRASSCRAPGEQWRRRGEDCGARRRAWTPCGSAGVKGARRRRAARPIVYVQPRGMPESSGTPAPRGDRPRGGGTMADGLRASVRLRLRRDRPARAGSCAGHGPLVDGLVSSLLLLK